MTKTDKSLTGWLGATVAFAVISFAGFTLGVPVIGYAATGAAIACIFMAILALGD